MKLKCIFGHAWIYSDLCSISKEDKYSFHRHAIRTCKHCGREEFAIDFDIVNYSDSSGERIYYIYDKKTNWVRTK